ncbi:MAG: UvrD-helicase domain-containing protein, partial [Gammaproteobacteria bacterium]|nr:UvrD-helicase domain-containing protein [Gammaproteobacteria bacterium]
MPSLNPRQQAAVRHLDSPLLVLAGAGSGKTRVITEKIGWLIRECGLAPRNIAAVTFTNKAAREMKARVGGLLGQNEVRDLTVSTFHTLGLNILRREHGRLGLRPGFTILDAQDTAGLVRELLRQDSGADPALAESHLHRISRWKNDLLDPATALSRAADAPEAAAARLYATYERQLRAYN